MGPPAPGPPAGFVLAGSDGIEWLEAKLGSGVARFTLGLDSSGNELDLGLPRPSGSGELDRVTASRRRLAEVLGFRPESVRVVDQVHGGEIRTVSTADEPGGFVPAAEPGFEADGLVTRDESVLAISVADCAAVAISGTRGRALLHCGWRGLGTDMLERAVEMVEGRDAAIGPCIGPCCFEVGPEVAELLEVERTPRGTVDLAGIAAGRLVAVGVGEVSVAELCTRCNPGMFFSYRRQGRAAGRQMALFSAT